MIESRRTRTAAQLSSFLQKGDVALFYSGEPVQKPGGFDQTYPFLPHPEYFWISGLRRARGIVAFNPVEGWSDFVQPVTIDEKLWEGGETQLPEAAQDVATFENWLKGEMFDRVFAFGQPTLRDLALLRNYGLEEDIEAHTTAQELVNRARRPKDESEVELVLRAADMAAAGYRKITSLLRPGLSEREIQIEYEAEVLRAGAEKFPYDTIVGSGVNSAVLHAVPTQKKLGENELVLIDAGADIQDYCVDITRVYSSSGAMTQQQRDLYALVLKAQLESIEMCRPGVEWTDVHRKAAHVLAQGLREMNVLSCDADTALAGEAIAVFLPHGVGHMVGHRVRDVGGIAGKKPALCCGARIRVDLPLEENFLMTVEPGLYFVQPMLDRAETRERFKTEINWSEVEKWRHVGGVRIEDDILVTTSGPRNLTSVVPK